MQSVESSYPEVLHEDSHFFLKDAIIWDLGRISKIDSELFSPIYENPISIANVNVLHNKRDYQRIRLVKDVLWSDQVDNAPKESHDFVAICFNSKRFQGEKIRVLFDGLYYRGTTENIHGCSGSILAKYDRKVDKWYAVGIFKGLSKSTRDSIFQPISLEDFDKKNIPSSESELKENLILSGDFSPRNDGDSHYRSNPSTTGNGDTDPGGGGDTDPGGGGTRVLFRDFNPYEIMNATQSLPIVERSNFVLYFPKKEQENEHTIFYLPKEGKIVCDSQVAAYYDLPRISANYWVRDLQKAEGQQLKLPSFFHNSFRRAQGQIAMHRAIQYDVKKNQLYLSDPKSPKNALGIGLAPPHSPYQNAVSFGLTRGNSMVASELGKFYIFFDSGDGKQEKPKIWVLDSIFGKYGLRNKVDRNSRLIEVKTGKQVGMQINTINPCLTSFVLSGPNGVVLYNISLNLNLGLQSIYSYRHLGFQVHRVVARNMNELKSGKIVNFTFGTFLVFRPTNDIFRPHP